ncbi:hypothetical protein SLEP1_g15161 [Rubroshorea leprosula]|uniref:Integrase catalytic domain-containing protein n=1 Tax=Rubroshorea leprosula TaxID=152421 RepID=A0AAV5ILH3_9ROSI|nr:hypothetical protein SLEP1_g15161 [Rubroshorea leprosula]
MAHFVETCNNVGTYGDLMVKQFAQSFEDAAFECICIGNYCITFKLTCHIPLKSWPLVPMTWKFKLLGMGQKKKSTLKELQQKEYPFADSEVSAIFEQLLTLNLIELPAPKCLEEVGRVNDLKYFRLEKEGNIQLESEEGSTATNVAMVSFGSFSPVPFLPVQPTPLMVQPKEFVNLEGWESSFESEDEVGDGWSTFISKSKKHRNPVSSRMPLPNPHSVISIVKVEASFKTHTASHTTKSFIDFSFANCTKKSRTMLGAQRKLVLPLSALSKLGPTPSPSTIQENHSQKPSVFSRLGAKQQNNKKVSKSQKVQKNKNKYMQRKKFQWRRKDIFDEQGISKPSIEKDDPRPIFLSVSLSLEQEARYVQLLTEYKDVFAWSYKEMPGVDPNVAVHHLAMKRGAIKGQVLTDFLADHPILEEWESSEGLPDEEVFFVDVLPSWKLYFDRASRREGARAGVVCDWTITPKSSAGHAYILAATDYFSKWVKVVLLREVKKENVVDFIRVNIIYRYGVPRYKIIDNGKPFSNSLMDKLCTRFKFAQHFSSMYNAAVNGLAKAFNKTLCNLLKKVVSKSKRDWHERMVVLPLECQIPSLRIAIQEDLTNEQNAKLYLQELEALDEKRLETQQHLECYQARLSRAFNKKVRVRAFQVGDVVLVVRRPIVITRHLGGKFTSKWNGPYVIIEVYNNGAYKIIDKDGL